MLKSDYDKWDFEIMIKGIDKAKIELFHSANLNMFLLKLQNISSIHIFETTTGQFAQNKGHQYIIQGMQSLFNTRSSNRDMLGIKYPD